MCEQVMQQARFYLTWDPWQVSADGLYLYCPSPAGAPPWICWHINGTNQSNTGKAQKQPAKFNLTQSPHPLPAGTRRPLPLNRLLFKASMPKPNGTEEDIFISLERIAPQGDTWFREVGKLSIKDQASVKYELPRALRQNLWRLSRQRHQTFKELVGKLQNAQPNAPMVQNAEPCWQSLSQVSQAMIACLVQSLAMSQEVADSLDLPRFRNPSWVFQLHRVLTEGRIQGHKSLPNTGTDPGYITHPCSRSAWEKALKEAQQGYTWDKNSNSLPSEEKKIMEHIAWWHQWGWADEAVDWLMPGDTEEEEYCFLRMHYPHWYCDLLWAMKKYRKGNLRLDWPLLNDIIMDSFVQASADYGQAFLSTLIRLANSVAGFLDDFEGPAAEVADWITQFKCFTVKRVIVDLRDRVQGGD